MQSGQSCWELQPDTRTLPITRFFFVFDPLVDISLIVAHWSTRKDVFTIFKKHNLTCSSFLSHLEETFFFRLATWAAPLRMNFSQLKVWCDTNRPDSYIFSRGGKSAPVETLWCRLDEGLCSLFIFTSGNSTVCSRTTKRRGDEAGHLSTVNVTGSICAFFTRMPAGNLFKHIQLPHHSDLKPAP